MLLRKKNRQIKKAQLRRNREAVAIARESDIERSKVASFCVNSGSWTASDCAVAGDRSRLLTGAGAAGCSSDSRSLLSAQQVLAPHAQLVHSSAVAVCEAGAIANAGATAISRQTMMAAICFIQTK